MPYSPASQKTPIPLTHPLQGTKEEWCYVTLRSATTSYDVLSFGSWLEPRYIFAARQLI